MEFTNKKQIAFEMQKYRQNPIVITVSSDIKLVDLYDIAKTRMFTKAWQYYGKDNTKQSMDEIMKDVNSQIIHDIFVADETCKELLSIPKDKTKTICEFVNENKKFFSKSASYLRTIYTLFVVDELGVREIIAQQNNPRPIGMLTRYTKCINK
jgi:hypothetical protein